jgi:hypothetical protein
MQPSIAKSVFQFQQNVSFFHQNHLFSIGFSNSEFFSFSLLKNLKRVRPDASECFKNINQKKTTKKTSNFYLLNLLSFSMFFFPLKPTLVSRFAN